MRRLNRNSIFKMTQNKSNYSKGQENTTIIMIFEEIFLQAATWHNTSCAVYLDPLEARNTPKESKIADSV